MATRRFTRATKRVFGPAKLEIPKKTAFKRRDDARKIWSKKTRRLAYVIKPELITA